MGAAAGPVARIVVLGAPGGVAPTVLARGLAAFAPGLIGYSLVALLSRALYAQGNARTPATALVVGWAVAIVADVALALAMPASWTVAAIGIGTSIGVTVSGVWLLVAVRRSAGPSALSGTRAGAAAAGFAGGLVAGACGTLAGPRRTDAPVSSVIWWSSPRVAAVVLVLHTAIVAAIDGPPCVC